MDKRIQLALEWSFLTIIFATLWCGFSVERPILKALFFTVTINIAIALNGVMRAKAKE